MARLAGWIALGLCCASAHAAASNDADFRAEAQAFRKSPSSLTRAPIEKRAKEHDVNESRGMALLLLGVVEMDGKQFLQAADHIHEAAKHLPLLDDYAAYLEAASRYELHEYPATEKLLRRFLENDNRSPLIGKAILLAGNNYLKLNRPQEAIAVLEKRSSDVSEPDADDLLGHAYEAAGNGQAANQRFLHIWIEHPASAMAADADVALQKYGKPTAAQRLARCLKLMDAGSYGKARTELTALLPALAGADLELAKVKEAEAEYQSHLYPAALTNLQGANPQNAELDAERLSYLALTARRADNSSELNTALAQLAQKYPRSKWRLQALVSGADYFGRRNDTAAAPLLQACAEGFAGEEKAGMCAWKLAFAAYTKDQQGSVTQLKEFLRAYPDSENAASAMYYLGRAAEAANDFGAAKAWYQQIDKAYPNFYYGMVARSRLVESKVSQASPSAEVQAYIASLKATPRPQTNFTPDAATQRSFTRAKLLSSAALDDLADSELRFGATHGTQPVLFAVELAKLSTAREQPNQGIRYIKHYAPSYIGMSIEPGTLPLLRLAYPLPYRKAVEDFSKEQNLDPYIVAGLVRQESEFNSKAVSRSNAFGLTQVLPSTGRELSRKAGLSRFNASMLFDPEMSLKLGTYYLRMLLDQLQGQWEATLASYNAGKRYATTWLSWRTFREPAEFVESIPSDETRNYVQSVLRNSDMYRRLYGQGKGDVPLPTQTSR